MRRYRVPAVAFTAPAPPSASSLSSNGRSTTSCSNNERANASSVTRFAVSVSTTRPCASAISCATSWSISSAVRSLYAPLAGITPGEVALLDLTPVPGAPVRMSTGVMVLYADDESFTFMTPEGHTLSAWITFSAYRDADMTVIQAQALERTSDPFDELAYVFGASKLNDRFWEETVANVARAMGAADPKVDIQAVCIDKRRQWRRAGNVRNSATLRTARDTLTAPFRWITRRG